MGAAGDARAASASCAGDGPPWVTIEIESPRLATSEALEFIEVDRTGCVTTRYGSMDVRAGTYRRPMDGAERAALAGLIAAKGVDRLDANGLRKRIAAFDAARAKSSPGAVSGVVVADGDLVRIAVDTGQRRNVVAWSGPVQEAALRPEAPELRALAEFIEALQATGADQRKQKLAEAGR